MSTETEIYNFFCTVQTGDTFTFQDVADYMKKNSPKFVPLSKGFGMYITKYATKFGIQLEWERIDGMTHYKKMNNAKISIYDL